VMEFNYVKQDENNKEDEVIDGIKFVHFKNYSGCEIVDVRGEKEGLCIFGDNDECSICYRQKLVTLQPEGGISGTIICTDCLKVVVSKMESSEKDRE
jgi:hypothetical protein